MATPAAYVTLSDCTVEGVFTRRGTVVELVPGSSLWVAYGGPGNLQPLAANETGDDASHAELGD
jgi:hypothetical protein